MDADTIKVNRIYGSVAVRSWVEFDGSRYVGMSMKTIYDRDGNITEQTSPTPTGVVLTY